MKRHSTKGITDWNNNPFGENYESWFEQNCSFTDHRRKQLQKFLNLSKSEILKLDKNEGRYVAFISIRWGYTKLTNNILVKTDKLDNYKTYNLCGEKINHNH